MNPFSFTIQTNCTFSKWLKLGSAPIETILDGSELLSCFGQSACEYAQRLKCNHLRNAVAQNVSS